MKVLVTGSKGFIGKNLIVELKNRKFDEIFEYDKDTSHELLERYTKECDFVYHLAGVNRPQNESEFMEGNFGFTALLLDLLKKNNNKAPVLITSSIQALLDNPYGKSKKAGEDLMFEYEKQTGAKVFVFRLPNVFGKWCNPNYNSVIATFCNNIANNLPIKVNDPDVLLNLAYIDDITKSFVAALEGDTEQIKDDDGFYSIKEVYRVKLGKVVELIQCFKETRSVLNIPDMSDQFTKKLYSTYLSYIPVDKFSYPLKMNIDNRGSFTEFIKTADRGQVSINISKPGITKGNHWHHTKNEKFLVVSGSGIIRFRKIGSEEVIEYRVSGEKLEVVDIPTGYTHSITNTGNIDMVTVMWANEQFDQNNPDTYFLEVIQ